MKVLSRRQQRQLSRQEQQNLERAEVDFSEASNALDNLLLAGQYAVQHMNELGEVTVKALEMVYSVVQQQVENKRQKAEDLWDKATRP